MYCYCIANCLSLRDTGGGRTVLLFSTRRKAERYCECVGMDPGRVRPVPLLKLIAVLVRQQQRGARRFCCDPDPYDKYRCFEITRILHERSAHIRPLRDVIAPASEN